MCANDGAERTLRELRGPMLRPFLGPQHAGRRSVARQPKICETDPGVRDLNCAGPNTTSTSTPEDLVRG
eukprot:8917115-Alexandrium_andersonii.AAC.1